MDELRRRIENERLDNAKLPGLLKPDALRQEYQQSDIFLFPSTWEGSPKVLLEAAASGLPVIARNSYQPESVVDGKTGYLAASDQEILARLGELLAVPGPAAESGRGRTSPQPSRSIGTSSPGAGRKSFPA